MFFLISNQKVIHFKIRMLVPTVSKKRVLQLPLVWEKSLLFERQYGFHNKVSTNPALIDITSKIQTTYVTKEVGFALWFICWLQSQEAFGTWVFTWIYLCHNMYKNSNGQDIFKGAATTHNNKKFPFKKCISIMESISIQGPPPHQGICPGSPYGLQRGYLFSPSLFR